MLKGKQILPCLFVPEIPGVLTVVPRLTRISTIISGSGSPQHDRIGLGGSEYEVQGYLAGKTVVFERVQVSTPGVSPEMQPLVKVPSICVSAPL